MRTSIIILTYNKLDYTQLCIDSIRKFTNPEDYELIIVDNHSTDGTVDWLKKQDDLKVIYNAANVGFPKGCNQGIEAASGDNILLLNNDVVVTFNWLSNLNRALYSDDTVGAVGAVTNNCSNYQQIKVSYKTIEEMLDFSRQYNKSNSQLWEQKLKLVGFCMLIKRTVVDKIGLLDEIFTPGNFEDDDYSYRIIAAGYKLLLCKDTFIHHFGSTSFKENESAYNDLLQVNRMKFKEKWGFDPCFSNMVNFEVIEAIKAGEDADIKVLEVGSGCGANLLHLKNKYKNASLYGIEEDESTRQIGVKIYNTNFSDISTFDYIILSDKLELLDNPDEFLLGLRKYLDEEGKIIANVTNVMNYTIIWELLNGRWSNGIDNITGRRRKSHYTLSEIYNLFKRTGYGKIEYKSVTPDKTKSSEEFVKKLNQLVGKNLSEQYEAYEYVIQVEKNDLQSEIGKYYYNLQNEFGVEQSITKLVKFDADELDRNLPDITDIEKANLLNFLAITCFENNIYKNVLDYLNKAMELDRGNEDIIYNIAYILYSMGNSRKVMKYLEIIKETHSGALSLFNSIKSSNHNNKSNSDELCNISKIKNAPRFVTLFPETENIHLTKDVGMIPFILHKYYGYDSTVVSYRNGEYPYLENEVKGLKMDYIDINSGDSNADGYNYLVKNSLDIDILQVYHLIDRTFNWINIYKQLNPNGKVYLKLDASEYITTMALKKCDLITVETKSLYYYLIDKWPLDVKYVPNGFYDKDERKTVPYEMKENVICTVGRIGTHQKATEILLKAFIMSADKIENWKLKIIGPVEEEFKGYINQVFTRFPQYRERIIFTGAISDKALLENEYKKAKIFCLTSRYEGFPLVFGEAIKNGCFIISTRLSPAWDITNNKQFGDLFEIDNVDQLANMLEKYCNDGARLQKACIEVQEFAYKKFHWTKICSKIDDLLEEGAGKGI